MDQYRLWLNCSKTYEIMVMAWNQRGHNDFSEKSVLSVLTAEGIDFVNSPKRCIMSKKTHHCKLVAPVIL